MIEAWLERFRRHERLALARLLTLVGRGEHRTQILARTGPGGEAGVRGGLTGSAGVGKSTLVGRLIERFRAVGSRWPCWRAIRKARCPAAPCFGDRFRMPSRPTTTASSSAAWRPPPVTGPWRSICPRWCGCWRRSLRRGADRDGGAGQGDTAVATSPTSWSCCCSRRRATTCNGRRPACWRWPTWSSSQGRPAPVRARRGPGPRGPDAAGRPGEPAGAARQRPQRSGVDELVQTIKCLSAPAVAGRGRWPELLQLAQEELAVRFHAAEKAGNENWRRLLDGWQQGRSTASAAVAELLRMLAKANPQ